MGDLPNDLLTAGTELFETHISWVFARGGDVFKVKKPVDFGFLDFTTLEARRVACEAEVTLNRRLAPDVYLGVVPVSRDADGVHRVGEQGALVDYAVHMRRLADADRGDVRLRAQRIGGAEVDRVAEVLAAFHAGARRDEAVSRFGRIDVIRANVEENFAQTRDAIADFLGPSERHALRDWQESFLAAESMLFEERIRTGRIVEGHGDLRLEHVYVAPDGGVRVIDCIEFNERFRHADVAADVAFLAMDLASEGRADLAERFLGTYARAANDYDLYPLVDFYESYRATVRGKIASFATRDPRTASAPRERALQHGRRYFALALAATRKPILSPMLVAVGGIIGSGKSTLAEAMRDDLSAPVVESDRTRKSLLAVAPTDHAYAGPWSEAYGPEFTDRVYAEVVRRADAVLRSGRSVIVDATFRTKAMRRAVGELARRRGVPFVLVECRAPADVCKARLRERAKDPSAVSDGRVEIFDDFVARWEPIDELSAAEHLVIDATRSIDESLATLRGRVPTWPRLP